MSEPLNDFLETVEALAKEVQDDDAMFGMGVRLAWVLMLEAEQRMDEFCKTHHTRRAPSTVKVPGREWPNDR